MLEASKRNIVGFIQQNWHWLIVTAIILTVVGLLSYGEFKVMLAKKKLYDLDIEKGVINQLIKKAQKDHYQLKTLSADTYKVKMQKYKERILKINEEVPALKVQVRKGAAGIFMTKPKIFKRRKKEI